MFRSSESVGVERLNISYIHSTLIAIAVRSKNITYLTTSDAKSVIIARQLVVTHFVRRFPYFEETDR